MSTRRMTSDEVALVAISRSISARRELDRRLVGEDREWLPPMVTVDRESGRVVHPGDEVQL